MPLSTRVLGHLDHIAASALTGPDLAAGRHWVAAVIRDAPKSKRRLEHLLDTFRALGPPSPAQRTAMELLNPPDPNLGRLMRLLQQEPSGGHLRALRDFEDELGAERVGSELDRLIEAGLPPDRSPYGVVRERLRQACDEHKAGRRQERAVFGPAGRPLEHPDDQYDAKVRRDAPQEIPHG